MKRTILLILLVVCLVSPAFSQVMRGHGAPTDNTPAGGDVRFYVDVETGKLYVQSKGSPATWVDIDNPSFSSLAVGTTLQYPGVSGSLPHFLSGSMAGKHIWYIGNSTVWNASSWYSNMCGFIADPKSPLYGMNPCRTDLSTLASDGSVVTAVFTGSVTYSVGQYITLLPGNPALNTFIGTCHITAVSGTQLTCTMSNMAAPAAIGATSTAPGTSYVSDALLNLGWNGQTIPTIISNMSSLWSAVQANDLVMIRGPLINDVRQGTCDLACAKTRLQNLRDAAAVPVTADFYWKIENGMLTTDPTSSGYVSPLASSAAYSTILHDAVMQTIAGKYSNTVVVDTQALLYGAAPATSPYMSDILHPAALGQTKEAMLDLWVFSRLSAKVGQQQPDLTDTSDYLGQVESLKRYTRYSPLQANRALQSSWTQCWTFYPDCVFNSTNFRPVAVGRVASAQAANVGWILFDWPGGAAGQIKAGDVVWQAGKVFQTPGGATSAASGANTMISGLGGSLPYATNYGDFVIVFHPLSVDALDVPYRLGTNAYPFAHTIHIDWAINGDFSFYYLDATYATKQGAAALGDTIILPGGVSISLTGCTFGSIGNSLRCTKAGTDFTAYSGKEGWLFGAHAPEGGLNTSGAVIAPGGVQASLSTPANAAAACVKGTMWPDADYLYVCTASGAIKRVAIATW